MAQGTIRGTSKKMLNSIRSAWYRVRKIALMPDEVMGRGAQTLHQIEISKAPVNAKVNFGADTQH